MTLEIGSHYTNNKFGLAVSGTDIGITYIIGKGGLIKYFEIKEV